MDFASAFVNLDVSDEDEEMEFGNRRGLAYSDCEDNNFDDDNSSEEDEDDEDDEGDDDLFSIPRAKSPILQRKQQIQPVIEEEVEEKKVRKLRVKKVDTNVLSLALGEALALEAPIMTGDPIVCKTCKAILSQVTKIIKSSSSNNNSNSNNEEEEGRVRGVWQCEFCRTEQEVTLENEEIPTQETNDYLVNDMVENIEAANQRNFGGISEGDGMTILCLDTSGSMCVTSELKGKTKIKGFERLRKQYEELNPEGEDQFFPRQKRSVTYISRLQCVQAAIISQIEQLEKNVPTSKVCLITFNNDVNVIGDGSQQPTIFSGDQLYNFESLLKASQELQINNSVSESAKTLIEKVYSLEENGATALAPALLVSIGIASRSKGSKVILCTDGKANVGFGSLEVDESQLEQVGTLYTKISDIAKTSGTSVSIMSIKGTDCRMEYLGSVADATGGDANVVDPLKLADEFAHMLADPVIATNVTVTLRLHEGLFCKEDEDDDDAEKHSNDDRINNNSSSGGGGDSTNFLVRKLGNVTSETRTTFEYGIKKGFNTEGLTDLPFQVQIRYSRISSGNDLIRVITKLHPITRNRDDAMKNADIKVLGTHAAQKSAALAMKGEYSVARAKAYQVKQLMKSVVEHQSEKLENKNHYNNWKVNMKGMEQKLRNVQQEEDDIGLAYSDDEADEDVESSKIRREKKKVARKTNRRDGESVSLFALKKANNLF